MNKIQPIIFLLLLTVTMSVNAQKRFIGPSGIKELKEDSSVILVKLRSQALQKDFLSANSKSIDAQHSSKDVTALKPGSGKSVRETITTLEKDQNVAHVYHAIWEDDSIPIIINGIVIVGVRANQSLDAALRAAGLLGRVTVVENPFNTYLDANGIKVADTVARNIWLSAGKENAFEVANAIYNTGLVAYADPDFYTPVNGTGEVKLINRRKGRGLGNRIRSLFGGFAPSPNDPLYVGQSSYLSDLGNLDSAYLWYDYARTVYATSGQGLYICDEGIDLSAATKHSDLNNLSGWGATASYTGGIPGSTSSFHGTFCGGIAAAYRNNGLYIAGIAGGANVKSVKLLGNAETTAQIANGINWIAADGYRVSSNSWSYATASNSGLSAVESAINNCIYTGGPSGTGMLVCFSSGTNTGASTVYFPGNMADVFCIGAVEGSWGTRQSYSNYGAQMDMVATVPAGGVVTLDRKGSLGQNSNDYATGFTGISAAVPQVAGVGTMVAMVYQTASGIDIASILRSTATHIGPGTGLVYETGWGWPNALAAIGEALHRDPATQIVAQTIVSTSYRDFELKVLDASSASVGPYYYTWSIDPSVATITTVSGYATGRRIRVTRTAGATGTYSLSVKFGPIGGRWITRNISVNFNGGAVNRVAAPATDSTAEVLADDKISSKQGATDPEGKFEVLVGPNPAHSVINVSLVDGAKNKATFDFIEILNMSGQRVFNKRYAAQTSSTTLDVTGYTPGIYSLIVHKGAVSVHCKVSIN